MAGKAIDKASRAMTPWRASSMDMPRWERDMDRMMEDFLGRRAGSWWPQNWFPRHEMEVRAPALDVFEDKDDVVVEAELPGMDKEDIEVNLTDNLLTIRGEKKKEEAVQEENYYRSERSYGSFVRKIELPTAVHSDRVKATFKNGILEVRVPKTEEARAKEIKVKVD